MKVQINPRGDVTDITAWQFPDRDSQNLLGLTQHDLNDLEFALAQRKAMSRRCTGTNGEHACGSAPGHGGDHLCRACTETWPANRGEEREAL